MAVQLYSRIKFMGLCHGFFMALLIDPVIHSMEVAERCLDELLQVHAPYLPQFSAR